MIHKLLNEKTTFKKNDSIKLEDYFEENKIVQYILLSGITNHLRLKLTISKQKVIHSLDSFSDMENLNYDIEL